MINCGKKKNKRLETSSIVRNRKELVETNTTIKFGKKGKAWFGNQVCFIARRKSTSLF